MQNHSIRIASAKEIPPMQASKLLEIPVLLSTEEMRLLFTALGDFCIAVTGHVSPRGEGLLSKEAFLAVYEEYIECLKKGVLPNDTLYRAAFSSVFTVTTEALYAILVGEDRQMIRIQKPVVQLQPHCFDYSPFDGKFRSHVLGVSSVVWGIQFSYPQLYEDPITRDIERIGLAPQFPNTQLFRTLQQWIRNNTVPTPFEVEGKKQVVPIRLGKEAFPWINQHPQLGPKGLKVLSYEKQ